jgi:hypothetical protein
MSQGIGQGHPCAIPEEPNAKADGIQWDHMDVGLVPSCAAGGQNGFCNDAVGIRADGRETECDQGVGNGRGARRISSR